MVFKGKRARSAKSVKLQDRNQRTLYVKLFKKIDKSEIEPLLKTIHPNIERVYLPRQKTPRFCFVLCDSEESKAEVFASIKKFKSDITGKLGVRESLCEPPKKKSAKTDGNEKRKIDPLTLVLEAIPKTLATEDIQSAFPKCTEAIRFNPRRCYLRFASIPDAFNAFKKLKTEAVCSYKISARYNKISRREKESSSTK